MQARDPGAQAPVRQLREVFTYLNDHLGMPKEPACPGLDGARSLQAAVTREPLALASVRSITG
jgi:hypothetical protein